MTPPLEVLLPNGEVLAVLVYIDDPIQGIIPWDGSSGGGGGSNVNLVSVGGSPVALGNTDAADSIPVTIAQDVPVLVGGLFLGTSVLPVNVDGGGSLFVTPQTLPPNAATENGTLALIQSNTFPLIAEASAIQIVPTGPMVQGIANTIPVSYADSQNAPLSLDLNSNLRVTLDNSTAVPLPTNAAKETGGNLAAIQSNTLQLIATSGAVTTNPLSPVDLLPNVPVNLSVNQSGELRVIQEHEQLVGLLEILISEVQSLKLINQLAFGVNI